MALKRKPRSAGKGAGRKYSSAHVNRSRRQRTGTIRRLLFTAAALAIVFVTVSFLILRSNNGISMFENGVGTIFKPVVSAFSSAASWVKGFFTDWRDYDKLQADYDQLQLEYEQITLQMSGMEELEGENDRLNAILDAKSTYDSLDPIYAKVIARDPGQWFDTFTIDRGTGSGVREGMSIVSAGGLVGYVYEAGLSYAKVMTIIDARSAVACLVQRTRDTGVMRGEVTADSDSAECHMYYLRNVNNIEPGDVIVTSGTDALYPKGLAIGEVIAVSQETSSEGSYVIVSPYADFRHIEDVLVLRTVVETAEDLPVVATPTPVAFVTPKPTQGSADAGSTMSPDASDDAWHYPTSVPEASATPAPDASPTPASTLIEPLPEDDWAN
jgi:rod shape-determining protein MreC